MEKTGLQFIELQDLLNKWITRLSLEDWKIDLEITDFKRKDFRQSGDIKVNLKNKSAVLLMTCKPFRDEENTIVHELVHLLLWKYDIYAEKIILKNFKKTDKEHMKNMKNLEETVKNLTEIYLNQEKSRTS